MLPCTQTHKVWLVSPGAVGYDFQVQHSRSALVGPFQTYSVQSVVVELMAVLFLYLVVLLQLQGLADPLEPPLVGQLRPLPPQCLLQLLLTHLDSDKVEAWLGCGGLRQTGTVQKATWVPRDGPSCRPSSRGCTIAAGEFWVSQAGLTSSSLRLALDGPPCGSADISNTSHIQARYTNSLSAWTYLNLVMFFSNSSFSRWNSVMYFCCKDQTQFLKSASSLFCFCLSTDTISANRPSVPSDLLLVRQLFVLLGQDLGQVQVAHLWVDFSIFSSFLHEEAKVRCQWLLREIWMSLKTRAPVSSEEANRVEQNTLVLIMKQTRTGSHLQFLAFVRILYKFNCIHNEFRHGSILTHLNDKQNFH